MIGFFCIKRAPYKRMNKQITEQICEVIDSLTSESSSRVLDIEWVPAEKVLRVYLENRDGSQVEMDHCVSFTRLIKDDEKIDELVPAAAYSLEVSSPGVEKPLRRADHFANASGETVFVTFQDKVNDRRKIRGVVAKVEGDMVTVNLEEGGEFVFDVNAVKKANTVYDWDR
jgi:ribosome maturation factor RimP